MKKLLGLMMVMFSVFTLSTLQASAQEQTDVFLTITGGTVTIGSTGSIDLGQITINSVNTPVSGQFSAIDDEYFFIEDLLGADAGYTTTVQSTDMTGSNGGTIPNSNIFFRGAPGFSIVTLDGSANPSVVTDLTTSNQSLDTPLELFRRAVGPNTGLIGRYGLLPIIEVLVPAYQQIGVYQGTITFTIL